MSEIYREGIITKGIGGFYYVESAGGITECRARGKFRKMELTPIVGDRVVVRVPETGGAELCEIKPRKNSLVRPGVSNVDAVMLVSAAKSPMPDLFLTDKMLVIAESKGIRGYICLNKTDIAETDEVKAFASVYERAGYEVVIASAATGEGVVRLREIICGKTVAFAGLSGVGKSSLLRRITGKELETGSVSRIERGRHTTRHVELMHAAGGFVFDTPGFSRLEADAVRAADLWQYFPEIRALHQNCRFADCNHIKEPGCAVLKAVADGRIAESRHQSYAAMFEKLKDIKEWERKD